MYFIRFKDLPLHLRRPVLEHLKLHHMMDADAEEAPPASRSPPKRAPPASQDAAPKSKQRRMRRPAAAG